MPSRRDFLKTSGLAILGTALLSNGCTQIILSPIQQGTKMNIKNIVLVHSAFVDGPSYHPLMEHYPPKISLSSPCKIRYWT